LTATGRFLLGISYFAGCEISPDEKHSDLFIG